MGCDDNEERCERNRVRVVHDGFLCTFPSRMDLDAGRRFCDDEANGINVGGDAHSLYGLDLPAADSLGFTNQVNVRFPKCVECVGTIGTECLHALSWVWCNPGAELVGDVLMEIGNKLQRP